MVKGNPQRFGYDPDASDIDEVIEESYERELEEERAAFGIPKIDPKEYNATHVPLMDQLHWVASNLGNPAATHRNAPNSATWMQLKYAQCGPKNLAAFWALHNKMLPTKKEMEEEEQKRQKAIADDSAMDMAKGFLRERAMGV